MDCSECERLWGVYAHATRKHPELIKASEQAALDDNLHAMRELDQAIDGAAEWREAARRSVQAHEALHAEAAGQDAVN